MKLPPVNLKPGIPRGDLSGARLILNINSSMTSELTCVVFIISGVVLRNMRISLDDVNHSTEAHMNDGDDVVSA